MDDVVDAVHDRQLLHVTEYEGNWRGFEQGSPVDGADDAAQKLVAVRSLISILDVDEDDAGSTQFVIDESFETDLDAIRGEVNALDDERDQITDELRSIEEAKGAMEPFVTLGIDIDLLQGYDSLSVAVGEGDAESVEAVLSDLDTSTATFSEGRIVAAFVQADPETLREALLDATFTAIDVPDGEGDPEASLTELDNRRQHLESERSSVEEELELHREDAAPFLLAAEETLAIEVEKAEAPLPFATTKNAFVAEGWIPTEAYDAFETAVEGAVDDRADVEELEVATYDRHGYSDHVEQTDRDDSSAFDEPERAEESVTLDDDAPAASDTETSATEVETDGGIVTMGDDEPPTVQDNPGPVKPFELLTNAVGRPDYSEFDPTIVLFLTFPVMFGFMIADVGYGLIYTGIGLYLYTTFDSDSYRSIGFVALLGGLTTVFFGFLFGEIFGLHLVSTYFWDPLVGGPPLHKGLEPAAVEWAQAWFVISALFGVIHLNVAYIFDFIEGVSFHGVKEAMLESGSWLLAMNGIWLMIFSRLFASKKPALLFTVFDHGESAVFDLGFSGLPVWTGWLGIALIVVGLVLVVIGPTYEILEFPQILSHPLSYLRVSAELLAEVGLAFAVNLLFWGGYQTEGEFHFMLNEGSQQVLATHEHAQIMFGGLVHGGILSVVLGLVVLVVGHLIVLALGVLSVGIQAIRLEYFEFITKFYEGNGIPYSPFGYDRRYTTDE